MKLVVQDHHQYQRQYGALLRAQLLLLLFLYELVSQPIFQSLHPAVVSTSKRSPKKYVFEDQIFNETDYELMDKAFIKDDRRLCGVKPSELSNEKAVPMKTLEGKDLVLCETVKPATLSGKIELYSQNLEDRFGYGLPRFEYVEKKFPLCIISPSSQKRINATFGGFKLSEGQEEVEINAIDAKVRNISNGETVRVYNERWETFLTARVTD